MTDEERNQVLKMIESGKITPEQGLSLIHSLEEAPDDGSPQDSPPVSQAGESTENTTSGESFDFMVDNHKKYASRFLQVILWIGIVISVSSGLGMYGIIQAQGLNAWLFVLAIPLLLGIALIAFSVGTHKSHFLYVDIKQKKGQRPERLILGFPLPLRFMSWLFRTFHFSKFTSSGASLDEIMDMLDTSISRGEPMVVNVEENNGSRVKVFMM